MEISRPLIRSAVLGALIVALIGGVPAFGADVIHNGVDLWMTVAGFAQTSFADQPIPAGFFCEGSQPFTGKIVFKGAPFAAVPADSLGGIDTAVRRLDDAAFNDKGEATTRIQLLALSLASVKPVETSCGSYDVAVSLAGEQPVTTMRIFRTEALGGTYSAPLALNVKAVFTPVNGDKSGRREVTRRIELGPGSRSVWAYVKAPQYPAGVKIDTNGDGQPDTVLPASSNFLAGVSPAVLKGEPARPKMAVSTPASPVSPQPRCPIGQCAYQSCHCDLYSTDPHQSNSGCDHLHCVWVCVACTAQQQPVPTDPFQTD
ncbi:MAG TPA: hypothetical protein VGS07_20075 [Thermoanaerobaculia bacterium]|jgi:hypothetical protein|nr:hypothetical protein [Thermoanaerobaculia bacterium]